MGLKGCGTITAFYFNSIYGFRENNDALFVMFRFCALSFLPNKTGFRHKSVYWFSENNWFLGVFLRLCAYLSYQFIFT